MLHVGTPQSDTSAVSLEKIASQLTRPTYVYDLDNVRLRGEALKAAFNETNCVVHYALKANNHPLVLKTINSLGFGADTVSAGEIQLALSAGISADRIIFSGVGKTIREIEFAIQSQIKQINVESPQELARIIQIARRLNRCVDVAFRMNPDVNPDTHPYITTGFRENKFGMDESFLPELKALLREAKDAVRLRGLTLHIGSQLLEIQSLHDAIEKTIAVHRTFEADGFALDCLDIGGGVGINYASADESSEFAMIEAYGKMVRALTKDLKVEIMLEPGRILVGRCGVLLTEVQYIKRAPAKTFAIVDTGMHHLLRPALYGARHRILPVAESRMVLPGVNSTSSNLQPELFDVVGPICESSDCIARDIRLVSLQQGDWLAIADAGAYGFTMASHYNAHELPAQICVSEAQIVS